MFRGSRLTRVDEKGRLKMPADFKCDLAEEQEFYITSLDGRRVQLHPMEEWLKREAALAKIPSSNPAKIRYLNVTSYYGQTAKIDLQGRLLLPQLLREKAKTTEEVIVIGMQEFLEVVNHELFKPDVVALTDAELAVMAEFGV